MAVKGLKSLLEQRKMSIDDLANETGIDKEKLEAFIYGKGKLQRAYVMAVAYVLGVKLEDFCITKNTQSNAKAKKDIPKVMTPEEIARRRKEIGKMVEEVRKKKGISYSQISAKINTGYYLLFIDGNQAAQEVYKKTIAEILEIPIENLEL